MQEEIKEKPWETKSPKPIIKPGVPGIRVTPVPSSPSSQPTTPLPKVPTPPPPLMPAPRLVPKGKKDITTLFLILAVIFNIFSLWVLVSIGMDKVPDFLAKFF